MAAADLGNMERGRRDPATAGEDLEMHRERAPRANRIWSRQKRSWPDGGDQGGGGEAVPYADMVAVREHTSLRG
jgi:hypothetical protein